MNIFEKKLADYEKQHPITNDADMIKAIKKLLELEESLPYESRNYDFINQAYETLLALEGEDISELNNNAKALSAKIASKVKVPRRNYFKIFIAASFLVLICVSLLTTFMIKNNKKTPGDLIIETDIDKEPLNSDINEIYETDPIDTNIPESEYTQETKETAKPPIGGGSDGCDIHNYGYHNIPLSLVNYIGNEKFKEWTCLEELNEKINGCYVNSNIFYCVEYFDIPDDILIEIYKSEYLNYNWNIKALIERNFKEFEYSSKLAESQLTDSKMSSEYMLKVTLLDMMTMKEDEKTIEFHNKITGNGKNYPVCDISIADLILNTSITKEDFIYAAGIGSSVDGEHFVLPHYEYNIDLLFGDPEELKETMDKVECEYYESRVKMCDAALHLESKE